MKVRCIDARRTPFSVGEVLEVDRETLNYYIFRGVGDGWGGWSKARFEPVTDEPDKAACPKCGDDVGYSADVDHCMGCGATDKDLLNLAFPCPKVDKYAEHREREAWAAPYIREWNDTSKMATARLHAGLESEKVRERGEDFSKAGAQLRAEGRRR